MCNARLLNCCLAPAVAHKQAATDLGDSDIETLEYLEQICYCDN